MRFSFIRPDHQYSQDFRILTTIKARTKNLHDLTWKFWRLRTAEKHADAYYNLKPTLDGGRTKKRFKG